MKLLSLILILCASSLIAADERPNIIFILADDMGYGDVQALNPDSKIPTPNLNKLAAQGMRFTDAHSPSAVCTPTRYALLTGRYSWRSRLKAGVLNGYSAPLIERGRPTVASHLKQAGYHTAIIGKWHLGLGFQKAGGKWDWAKPLDYSPVDAGFERSLVIPASLDFPPYVYIEGHEITAGPDRTQPASGFPGFLRKGELGADFSIIDSLDRLTKEATEQIEESAAGERPFFLYFPLTAPHKPVMPHPRFQGKSGLGPYGDFVMQVDWTVGEVLAAIDRAGIADHTIVFYSSDNGSFMHRTRDASEPNHVKDEGVQAYFEGDHTANGPYRGTKADIWEAGHRVPFFVRWPKVIRPGSECHRTICHADFFATAAALANSKLPPAGEAAPDSFNLLPLFRDQGERFERAPVINHSAAGMFAIRDGVWKLVLGNGSGGREQPKGRRFDGPWQLYNLADDIGETDDRMSSESDRAQKMEGALLRIIADERSR